MCRLIHPHLASACLSDSYHTDANKGLRNVSEWKHEHDGWLTGDGLGAAHALLCIQVAEAFEAVGVVFPGGEALTRQLLSAADA